MGRVFTPSAAKLAGGLVCLVVGQTVLSVSHLVPAGDSARGVEISLTGVGLAATAIGLVVLLTGMRRLAVNVDLAAQLAVDVLDHEEEERERVLHLLTSGASARD